MHIDTETFFRMLADSTRLRTLMLLQREHELCVCELTHTLGLSQPKISRHLAQLRESGVVLARRAGLWMYYRINPELPPWALANLQSTLDGLQDAAPFAADYRVLAAMPDRPDARCCA
ncbi:MAG: metalloregulator ArsR/SmtB family transcription factor [Gammaproteobacteria bacterium]